MGITPLVDSQDLGSVELVKDILMDKFLSTFIKGMCSESLRVGVGVSMQFALINLLWVLFFSTPLDSFPQVIIYQGISSSLLATLSSG